MMLLPKTFLALSSLVWVGMVHAAPIVLNGDYFTVSYDDAQVGVFKSGKIAGSLDTVYFQPTAFNAFSAGAPTSTQAGLQLTFNINPGYVFTGMTFTERGDYSLFGGGAVNVASSLKVSNAATPASTMLNVAPSAPYSQPGSSLFWELIGSTSLSGLGTPQTLLVNLNSELFSMPVGGLGFIQNTYAGFKIQTAAAPAAIPEPATWALGLIGLLAALLVNSRRKAVLTPETYSV